VRSLLGIAVCLIAVACSPSTAPDSPTATTEDNAAAPAPAVADSQPDPSATIEPEVLVDLLEQEIPYGEGPDGNLIGFLAVPADAAEPLPGVIVIHEWWGLTPEIHDAARRIARAGYVVLAVDLYGGRAATDVAGAQALMGELVGAPDQVRENIRQAYEYLELYAFAPRVGVVGWDLGGRWALQAALMYPQDLDSAAIIYGAVETDEAVLATLQMPLLGLFGENDASVPIDAVREFRTVLLRLEKPAEVRIYPGAEHGFFFTGGDNYAPLIADDAWTRLLGHLASALQQ
jgi:carboxymethylenebutenolidase